VTALDGFYTTYSDARATFGKGTPQPGAGFDNSAQLRDLGVKVDAAAPGPKWTGAAATGYGNANDGHREVFGKLAELDQKLAAQVDQSARAVAKGRQHLDAVNQWVTDAANSVPPGKQRDTMLMQIAAKGLGQLTDVVKQSNDELSGVGNGIRDLKGGYDDAGIQRFATEGKPEGEGAPDEMEDEKPNGKEDGEALAEQAALPSSQRDPAVLDQVADNLPPSPLTQAQIAALAEGRDVDDVPKETLDYYRDFYKTAGKDGLLLLDRQLESQEAAGNPDAGAQRDRLANGLTVTSNENVVERNPDGSIASRGGYDQLPPDLREMLEVRREDPTYPGSDTLGPTEAKNRHVADVVQFSELMGEANPGYQPGSRLGTEMYLKSADMIEYSQGGWGMTDTPPEAYERAANTLADVAGRNSQASYEIWSGNGADLPEGYNGQETVRTLMGHDWSRSGTEGSGAATLLDWITEDSQRRVGDPLGDRARVAFTQIPDMLASNDTDPVWSTQRDAFARNDAVSMEMSRLLAANTSAMSAPGAPFGFPDTKLDASGQPLLSADDADRLLQLGSYTDPGRVLLATAAETMRIDELQAAMEGRPDGTLSAQVANSAAGGLSGRMDNAMIDALTHQNQLLENNANDPRDALYRAKIAGAEIAGGLSNELIGKIPGAGSITGVTGLDPGQMVEDRIRDWIGKPEYQAMTVPDNNDMLAESTQLAQQTILQAAYDAKQLPPEFVNGGGPVDVATLPPGGPVYRAMQQYFIDRGLTQYVTDFGQSYSAALNAE
jgi:hypothetical protein